MKNLIIAARLIITMLFAVISALCFTTMDFLPAVVMLITCYFTFPFKNKLKNKEKISEKEEDLIDLVTREIGENKEAFEAWANQGTEDRKKEIQNFNYKGFMLKNRTLQLLESFSIMSKTKNVETLVSRYEYVESFYDEFVMASNNKEYESDIKKQIQAYYTIHDHILVNEILMLVKSPEHSKMKAFYSECLRESFNRFLAKKEEEIQNLKRKDAKKKRIDNIIDTADLVISELIQEGSHKEKFQQYEEEIQAIRDYYFEIGYPV